MWALGNSRSIHGTAYKKLIHSHCEHCVYLVPIEIEFLIVSFYQIHFILISIGVQNGIGKTTLTHTYKSVEFCHPNGIRGIIHKVVILVEGKGFF